MFPAEFIIDLADKNPTFDAFKKCLIENGAEFSDSFMTNLLRIIQHMKPVSSADKNDKTISSSNPLATKFPGLAIPNEKPPVFSSEESSDEDEKKNKNNRITNKDLFKEEAKVKESGGNVIDQAMAELEALAPSNLNVKKEEKKDIIKDHSDSKVKRDRSRERNRKRSRSKDRRSRTPDRRNRSRERDKDRRRRSRSRHRHRSRSRDRNRRSRSRGRRSRSRGRRSRSRGRRLKSRSRSHDRHREDSYRYRDFDKRKKKSPEVEMSDDPEPGKVFYFCIHFLNLLIGVD